jgi:hypothetical protein
MRFQIHSDIHLEKYPHRRIKPQSSHLILAGDIGVPIFDSYFRFFRDTSRNFDQIIYVAGNHEYERCWMGIDKNNFQLLGEKFIQRKNLIAEILASFPNVVWLDNQQINIGQKTIYGTTLWCDYTNKKNKISTQQFITAQHQSAIEMLKHSTPDILISHYVSNREGLDKPWNMGLGVRESLHYEKMIFGHIHYLIHKNINQTELFCNPWGEDDQERYLFLD